MSMEGQQVGAVLVVGGGIGGIQAALDSAESGYKVYLVEDSPAIGGVMAQLDKTLPTNDCSICILSPKLVECGRHFNIELLTYSEVLGIKGESGDFTVSVKKKARFVDETKCTGCNLCAEGCPVVMKSEFDQGLGVRKAIYTPYPQAVPRTYVIDKREERPCKAACKDACPIHMNVPGYIALITEGKIKEAYELIRRTNPLPGICGRVCYAPCENACNRGQIDEPIASRALKRFVADQIDIDSLEVPQITINGKKVAIIGSGPAGLSAAHDLALEGYSVTIFEALTEPGGMLRYGIPEYRLPKDVLGKEIGHIERLGVEIKTNTKIGGEIQLEEMKKFHEAIFISTGAHESLKLKVPNEDSPGVIHAIDFLQKVNTGERVDIGKKVVVVGGGNTAIDASRVAKRLGADVEIIYRRSREEMPATEEEVKAAEEEGVKIMFLATPTRIITEDGRVSKMECIRMELGAPDESGRRRPVPIEGSEFIINADTIIPALGQAPNVEFVKGLGLEVSRRGTIIVDATLATNIEGIFAGGDVVTGPAIVIDAIAAGKKAARSIDEYLKEEPLTSKEDKRTPQRLSEEEVAEIKGRFPSQNRVKAKELELKERIGGFEEVEQVYFIPEAQEEAGRCLASQIEGCIRCGECEDRCEAKAINYEMQDEYTELKVGSVILAPGFDEFDPQPLFNYGYKKYPNVVTSIEFERMLSASGPFQGELLRPSDKKHPQKIAWIQCIGSRDISNPFCSSVCCTYAIKEAIVAKEHAPFDLDTAIFFMDIRAFGKGYEQYYNRAKEEYGVRFIRSKVYGVEEVDGTGNLALRFAGEDGKLRNEESDLVVLSVGFQPSKKGMDLAKRVGIRLNKYGFCRTDEFSPVETSKPGIYVCGCFQSPKDIPETVMQASAAVAKSSALLAPARNTLVKEKEYPLEKDVSGEEPRVGVFICHCGINIGGIVNVPEVTEYAKTLPNVVYAENNLYTCSQDTQERIRATIGEHDLNRVVVASCTPRTHEPLFQETIKEAGLNRYLFEMANIRDQCSWVHMREPDKATEKAKDLVQMAVAKAGLIQPLKELTFGVINKGLVIGGGIAGMTAALELANQGFDCFLIERKRELGGNLRRVYHTLEGGDVQKLLENTIQKIKGNELIHVFTNAEIKEIDGFVGNFKTTIKSNGQDYILEHGAVILASGGEEYKPTEYLYGKHDRVLTQLELEQQLAVHSLKAEDFNNVVMIQCVGSRNGERPYCSRICCSQAIKNALKIKEENPKANIYVLYRDIRTYGFREEFYCKARSRGVIFIRYDEDHEPKVSAENGKLEIEFLDPILRERLIVDADLLVLSVGVIPSSGREELSKMLKVPLNEDGFFLEAHVKLRPVEFATDGIFLCGLAHSPKPISENISQAQAAAAKAAALLSKESIASSGVVAEIDKEKCVGCGLCVQACYFNAISLNEELGVSEVNPVLCKGCGKCAVICPSGACQIGGFKDEQILSQVGAYL